MDIPPAVSTNNSRRKAWFWILGLFILAVLAVAANFLLRAKPKESQTNTGPTTKTVTFGKTQYQMTEAVKGEIISNFPKDLLLDPSATITQSHVITDKSGRQNVITIFNTSKSAADILKLYKTYFASNSWKISSENKTTNSFDHSISSVDVTAASNSAQLHVVIAVKISQPTSTAVSLNYFLFPTK